MTTTNKRLKRITVTITTVKTLEEQLSPEQVAERLNVSARTVKRWKKSYEATDGRDGMGPWAKLGRRVVRIAASAVAKFLEARHV